MGQPIFADRGTAVFADRGTALEESDGKPLFSNRGTALFGSRGTPLEDKAADDSLAKRFGFDSTGAMRMGQEAFRVKPDTAFEDQPAAARNVVIPLEQGIASTRQGLSTGSAIAYGDRLRILGEIDTMERLGDRQNYAAPDGRFNEAAYQRDYDSVSALWSPMHPAENRFDPLAYARHVNDPEISQYAATRDPAERQQIRDRFGSFVTGNAVNIGRQEQTLQSLPRDPAMEALNSAETFADAAGVIWDNPALLIRLNVQSLPQTATAIGGAVLAGPVGAGAGSFVIERGSTILDSFREVGVDVADPDALKAAFESPSLVAAAKEAGLKRGLPIAFFDALAAGAAVKSVARNKVADLAAQTGFQAGAGGTGEAAAQVATTGKISGPGAIIAEAAAEVPGGAVEATGIGAGAGKYAEERQAAPAVGQTGPTVPEGAQPGEALYGVTPGVPTAPQKPDRRPDSAAELRQLLQDERPLDTILKENQRLQEARQMGARLRELKRQQQVLQQQNLGGRFNTQIGDVAGQIGQIQQGAPELIELAKRSQKLSQQNIGGRYTQELAELNREIGQIRQRMGLARGDGSARNPLALNQGDDIGVGVDQTQEPTQAQAEAGNYRKRHLRWQGLQVSIETEAGQTRRGTGADGTPWEVEMPVPYGYVRGTEGRDGDQVDIYLGPKPELGTVFLIDQIDPKTRRFDEHKAMIGFESADQAGDAYDAAFSDHKGPQRIGAVTVMTADEFKNWLRTGNTKRAAAYVNPKRDAKPADLIAFLISKGGIMDEGGELAGMDAGKSRPGLVNNKTGMEWDYAREAAAEAGYIIKGGVDDSMADATVNDLMDAIGRNLRGERIVTLDQHDQELERVAEEKAANDRARYDDALKEVQDLAKRLGYVRLTADEVREAALLSMAGTDPEDALADVVTRVAQAAIEEETAGETVAANTEAPFDIVTADQRPREATAPAREPVQEREPEGGAAPAGDEFDRGRDQPGDEGPVEPPPSRPTVSQQADKPPISEPGEKINTPSTAGEERPAALKERSKRDFRPAVAYHGSPHDFDQFSTEKIGTGEGAQAYGWGLYFAGKREVSEYYRDKLAGVEGDPELRKTALQALRAIDSLGFDTATEALREIVRAGPSWTTMWDIDPSRSVEDEAAFKAVSDYLASRKSKGKLYHVDIPEDSELLDWDKPMKDQPPAVKAAIIKAGLLREPTVTEDMIDKAAPDEADKLRKQWASQQVDWRETGETFYRELASKLHPQEAAPSWTSVPGGYGTNSQRTSEALRAAGIPGLRYADQNSRGVPDTVYFGHSAAKDFETQAFDTKAEAERAVAAYRKQFPDMVLRDRKIDKSHNYVIFDDSRIKTVAKFARPTPATTTRAMGIPTAASAPIADYTSDQRIKAHRDYAEAKAGDPAASVRLIRHMVKASSLAAARERFGSDVLYVPVIAEEANGHNAIPVTLAEYYAAETGAETTTSIEQVSRAYHTGARAMERMVARPVFDGQVERGRRYVIVDDVSVMGSTIAELADYIRRNGGEVAGAVLLVNAGRSGVLSAPKAKVQLIERRFGDAVREIFGIEPAALTADEADYLSNFKDADQLRTSVATAFRQRDARLRAKGIPPEDGGGVADTTKSARAAPKGAVGVSGVLDLPVPDRASGIQPLGRHMRAAYDPARDAARRELQKRVTALVEQFAGPGLVRVRAADKLWEVHRDGKAQPIWGGYSAGEALLAVALNAPDTEHFARHEIIHLMREFGLIPEHHWAILERAAEADWMTRYRIAARYPDFDRVDQLEEAIAEAFGDFREGRAPMRDASVIAILQRMQIFFMRIVAAIKRAFNGVPGDFDTKAKLIFQDIERGLYRVQPRGAGRPAATQTVRSARGPLSEVAKRIVEFVTQRRGDRAAPHKRIRIGIVQPFEASQVREKTGLEIGGRQHVIAADYLDHIERRHGPASGDRWPLTEADFSLLPEIYSAPDSVHKSDHDHRGMPVIVYEKLIGNRYVAAEFVRPKEPELVLLSLVKRPAGSDAGLSAPPNLNAQDERGDTANLSETIADRKPPSDDDFKAARKLIDTPKKQTDLFKAARKDVVPRNTTAVRRRDAMMEWIAKGQPIDRAVRMPFTFFGGVDASGRWNPGERLYRTRKATLLGAVVGARAGAMVTNPVGAAVGRFVGKTVAGPAGAQLGEAAAALTGGLPGAAVGAVIGGGLGALFDARFDANGRFAFMNPILESARIGAIDRYGLSDEYLTADRKRGLDERRITMQAVEILKTLKEHAVDTAEAKTLQAILTGEKVDSEAMNKLAQPIREAIDALGQEAVHLGLLSPESFERNRGAYLHRLYLKHEDQQDSLGRWVGRSMTSYRKRIIGHELKGRGIFFEEPMGRVMRDVPGWQAGTAPSALKGQKFRMLDRIPEQAELEGISAREAPRVIDRVFWPAGKPIPDRYQDYTDRGTWEVRELRASKVTLWRDYTKKEREQMGEILDARYTIAKTFMLMGHDIATGRFYKDISEHAGWTQAEEPKERWMDAHDYNGNLAKRLFPRQSVEWVKVPEAEIPGTGGKKKWGALSNRFVRAEIWRDLNELAILQQSHWWKRQLTTWKKNKTARSPVVHMNNVMSNFLLMDMADVRVQDLVAGLKAYIRKDADYQDAADHGVFGVDMVSQELRRDVLEPLLKDLRIEMLKQQHAVQTKAGMLSLLAERIHGAYRKMDRGMLQAYQIEDDVFRMAAYMRHKANGLTPEDAAAAAREEFIDYDIRAPWVVAARNSLLPFISYTYRATPLVARMVATRPWKFVKYATIAYAMGAMAYMIAPGDEDDERKSLREEEQGYTWMGTPQMMRMPFRDSYGNPVFFDSRRWIPAGDVFDMGRGQGAVPVPAPLLFGGPLMLGAELAFDKSSFTGEPIVPPYSTPMEQTKAVADHVYKSWMPSAPWVPGSWYWEKVGKSVNSRLGWDWAENIGWGTEPRDWQGRPLQPQFDIPSAFGVKLKPQDVEFGLQMHQRDIEKEADALRAKEKQLGRDLARDMISQATYDAKIKELEERMERLGQRMEYYEPGSTVEAP